MGLVQASRFWRVQETLGVAQPIILEEIDTHDEEPELLVELEEYTP